MVQHSLFVKNVSTTLLRTELVKLLGEQHKIVSVSFRLNPKKKGDIKYALVVVDSQSDLETVIGLINKKLVNGKELQVTSAKQPHEKESHLNRVAKLKNIEKFPSIWPPPTYNKVAKSNPLKNQSFPHAFVHGEKLSIQPPKTIKKSVSAPSRALYLSKIPKSVPKKQILEAFKNVKVRRAIFTKNHKRLNYAFLVFKNADEKKKALDALKDQKITIGDNIIEVKDSTKYAKQTVEVPNDKLKSAAPTAEKKELSANAIAKKQFIAYRLAVHNHNQRLKRRAAIKKINQHKQAVAQGKAQPRVVRKVQSKPSLPVKNSSDDQKKARRQAAREAQHARARLIARNIFGKKNESSK